MIVRLMVKKNSMLHFNCQHLAPNRFWKTLLSLLSLYNTFLKSLST